jgi:hypothetical protein
MIEGSHIPGWDGPVAIESFGHGYPRPASELQHCEYFREKHENSMESSSSQSDDAFLALLVWAQAVSANLP